MTTNNQDKPDFGARLSELEAITEWFESGEVDLDQALAKFERGMKLASELKHELEQVENRVEKIKARFELPPESTEDTAEADPPDLFS